MAHVHFSGEAARRFTGGLTEIEVEANNFRRMVLELDRRFLAWPPDRGGDGSGDRPRDLPGRLSRPAQA